MGADFGEASFSAATRVLEFSGKVQALVEPTTNLGGAKKSVQPENSYRRQGRRIEWAPIEVLRRGSA